MFISYAYQDNRIPLHKIKNSKKLCIFENVTFDYNTVKDY